MRRIMVLNPKGGCGKSTIATNLASYYAGCGKATYLIDFDVQGSSMDWLEARPQEAPAIQGVLADDSEFLIPHGDGVMIMDAPAGVHGKRLKQYLKRAQTLLIPVLPSPMDIRATARFVEELLLVGRVKREKIGVAVLANRVREQTRVYHSLERFLDSLDIPFIATLRDSQNYIRGAQTGQGIFELPAYEAGHDVEQWQPLLDWLQSPVSMPNKKS